MQTDVTAYSCRQIVESLNHLTARRAHSTDTINNNMLNFKKTLNLETSFMVCMNIHLVKFAFRRVK